MEELQEVEPFDEEELKLFIENLKIFFYDIRTHSFDYDWCEILNILLSLYLHSFQIQDIEVYKEFLLTVPELSKILISQYGIDYDYEKWKEGYDDGEWTFHAPGILRGEFPLEELPEIMREMAKEMYYTKEAKDTKNSKEAKNKKKAKNKGKNEGRVSNIG